MRNERMKAMWVEGRVYAQELIELGMDGIISDCMASDFKRKTGREGYE